MTRILLCLAILSLAGPAQQSAADRAESKACQLMAERWAALTRLAIDEGCKSVATRAIDHLERLGAAADLVAELGPQVQVMKLDDEVEAVRSLERKTVEDVVKELDKLGKRRVPPSAEQRFEEYLWLAMELDPGDRRRRSKIVQMIKRASRNDPAKFHRLLFRTRECDPEGVKAGAYLAIESAVARKDLLRVKAPGHPLQALILLPKNWSAKRRWPVVLYIDGARCEYETAASAHRSVVDKKGYIVVVPVTLSNGNDLDFSRFPYEKELLEKFKSMQSRPQRFEWEREGVDKILELVRESFGGEDKHYMTGYSAGGFATYWWIHHRPEQLHAAAPVSANYWSPIARGGKESIPDGGPPIRIFTGSQDSAGQERIFPQSAEALAALQALGFTDVERVHIQGRDHERFTREAFEFFEEVRAGSRRRG